MFMSLFLIHLLWILHRIYFIFVAMFFPVGTALASLPGFQETLASAAQTVTNIKHWKEQAKREESAVNVSINCGKILKQPRFPRMYSGNWI